MAQVNIKPNRIKFIKALEESIKRIEREHKENVAARKQYAKDLDAWCKTADLSADNIKSAIINTNHSDEASGVTVILKKYPPNKPKRPDSPDLTGWRMDEALAEMNSIIAMLKLTDEDVVSASVANKVARYL